MKIINPLPTAPAPKTKPTKKKSKKSNPNRTERFVDDVEESLFAHSMAASEAPTSGENSLSVQSSSESGLTNVSVRRKVYEYLPQVEQVRIAMLNGTPLHEAMERQGIPFNSETLKAFNKAIQLSFIIAHRSTPEVERLLVQAARGKFLTEALLEGNSDKALKWAKLIQEDSSVFEKQLAPTLMLNADDLGKFIEQKNAETTIDADFEEIFADVIAPEDEGEEKEKTK